MIIYQNYLTDPQMSNLMQLAVARLSKSRAQGTLKNKEYTIKEYLTFCYKFNINPTHPQTMQWCAFTEQLMQRRLAPATIKNKLSHIRTWIRATDGSMHLVNEDTAQKHMDAIIRTSSHVPNIKEPVSIRVFKSVLMSLNTDPEGWILRASFLLLIYGGFRQSEILPPSQEKYNKDIHLTRSDVIVSPNQVQVTIKYGKNLFAPEKRRVHVFKTSPNQYMCPVVAVNNVIAMVPTMSQDQPMFTFPDSGKPVPASYLAKVWKQALINLKQDHTKFSLHSLRKSMVSGSYMWGVPETQIQEYGAWTSSAYKAYLRTNADINVNTAMIDILK